MAKEIKFRNIYGCPKHGKIKGVVASLKLTQKDGTVVKKPCFRCDACNRVYLEPTSGVMGEIKGKCILDRYKVWHTIGPYPIPETVYVYDPKVEKKLCSCQGNIKAKTKSITHFLLKNGTTESVSSVKVCLKCKKVFISKKTYSEKESFLLKQGIEIRSVESDKGSKIKEEESLEKNTDKKANANYKLDNWENDVFAEETVIAEDLVIEKLKPANRIASAYYDAKITYNPYQYLPWLKMYINGCDKLLISDEVGLGKTIEAGILMMEALTENVNAKILVMCPAFLREKWYQELNEKFLFDPQIFDGKTLIDESTNIVILPISRMKQFMEQMNDFSYDMVVVDEIHYFKNPSSVRYEQIICLLSKIKRARYVFMSATPVNNSGNDYRSIERLFGCKPEKTNTTKKQAYISLPNRHIHDVFVDLNEEEQAFYDVTDVLNPFSGTVYRHIGSSCLYALGRYAYSKDELSIETKDELISAIEMLSDGYDFGYKEDYFEKIKKMTLPEIDSKFESLKDVLRGYEAGSRVVIFTHYIETVKYLYSELAKEFSVGYIYANNVSSNIPCKHIKNRFVDAKEWFSGQFAETVVLICSDSCREGIDLDVANILINYDLPFNPSILEQRIGRIDRMSQKKNMEIYNFHVNNTYDDRLHFILSAKLRFINFYADYGIGNPLNITTDGDLTFNNFIRYFSQKIAGDKDNALMSNDDFFVASKILRMIGVKIEKKEGIDAFHVQDILLNQLKENREKIEKWFGTSELQNITNEQLIEKKAKLENLLGFPSKIRRKLELDDNVKKAVVDKANSNSQFRRRIAILIEDYEKKISNMEITGLPMQISEDDLKYEYVFGTGEVDSVIQSSVIEVMRKEGAKIYEIG